MDELFSMFFGHHEEYWVWRTFEFGYVLGFEVVNGFLVDTDFEEFCFGFGMDGFIGYVVPKESTFMMPRWSA